MITASISKLPVKFVPFFAVTVIVPFPAFVRFFWVTVKSFISVISYVLPSSVRLKPSTENVTPSTVYPAEYSLSETAVAIESGFMVNVFSTVPTYS